MEQWLVKKRGEDLAFSQQIKDHPIEIKKTIFNTVQLVWNIVLENQTLADYFHVKLGLDSPITYDDQTTRATFTSVTDEKWLKILIQKLLEISILISSQKDKEAKVSLVCIRGDDFIEVVINFDFYISDQTQQEEIFMTGFGSLNSINRLSESSGMEGSIAKYLADQLNTPLKIIINPQTKQTSFVVYIHI